MHRLLLISGLLCNVFLAFSQESVPLEKRAVLGTIVNARDEVVMGATVSLTSPLDTMQLSTDQHGSFRFDDVRSADFLIVVESMGYSDYNRRYFNNDTKHIVHIPTIRLGIKVEELEEVMISRLRGSVVRGDTTEFWARDYIVRDFARLKDLLVRMEGITIDDEGSVFHNGKPVTKALFNNEQYFSGSVKEAIKDLPADIVARIQIIDRNAEGSGSVQLQSQEKTKVMNIVTKEDKSAGRMIELGLAQGLPPRSRLSAGMRRIDGSRQLALEGGFSRAPEGIKADDVPGTLGTTVPNRFSMPGSGQTPVSGGQQQMGWLKVGNNFVWDAFRLYPEYRFEPEHRKSNTHLYSEQYFDSGDLRSDVASRRETRQQTHRFIAHAVGENFEKKTYHMTDFRLNQQTLNGSTVRNTTQTGFANRRELEEEDRESRVTDVSFYPQYMRTLSARWQLGLDANIRYYSSDEGIGTRYEIHALAGPQLSPDSSIRQWREEHTLNWTSTLQSLLTWTASSRLKIQFRLAADYREGGHDVEARVWDGEMFRPDAARSSYLRTSSLGVPMSVTPEYTFKGGFYVAPELAWQPRLIRGEFQRGTAGLRRRDAVWSSQMKTGYRSDQIGNIALGYRISNRQPEITQLNPVTVYQTPFLVQVGNPDLRGPLSRNLNARYAHFFKRLLFNISASSEFEKTDRMIVMDRRVELDPAAHTLTTITQLVNADGGSRRSHDLNLSKTLGKSRSTWKYTGSLDQRGTPYLTDGVAGTRTYLSQDHRMTYLVTVAPWLDIAPDLRYQTVENRYAHGSFASRSHYRMFFTEMKVNVFLPKEVRINLNISQMINRTTNSLTDEAPFVLNANIEKRIFRNKSGVISFVVMDLARQNAFTYYTSDEYGYRNTVTNPDSRYFMLQFAWKPEYWGKSKVSEN